MKIVKFLTFIPFLVSAQTIDYSKIVLPESVVSSVFEERLVQLAWKNHPSNKTVLQTVQLAENEKKLAGRGWLNEIYASGNLNEFTIDPSKELDNIFFPRYNFGIRLSLGTFINTPLQSRIAGDRLQNARNNVDEQKLLIREIVMTNVEKLKQYYKFIKLREQIREDYLAMYRDAERKFSIGEVTIEVYRTATQVYYKQAESVVEAQSSFNNTRIALESLIGISITDVSGYQDFIKKLDDELKSY